MTTHYREQARKVIFNPPFWMGPLSSNLLTFSQNQFNFLWNCSGISNNKSSTASQHSIWKSQCSAFWRGFVKKGHPSKERKNGRNTLVSIHLLDVSKKSLHFGSCTYQLSLYLLMGSQERYLYSQSRIVTSQ